MTTEPETQPDDEPEAPQVKMTARIRGMVIEYEGDNPAAILKTIGEAIAGMLAKDDATA